MQNNQPVTTDPSLTVTDVPIRFPHIPSRRVPPPGTANWIRKEDVSVRVDATHKESFLGRSGNIPGVRTEQTGKVSAEAFDERLLPSPATREESVTRREKSDLLVMTEQLRHRLVDFGNILARSEQADPQLERAFETVCRSYSQLATIVQQS